MYAKSAAVVEKASTAVGIHSATAQRKWTLQRHAQQLLSDKRPRFDKYGKEVVHFKYRVAMCHRGTDGVAPEIRRSGCGERAEYFGLQTCGSVWHCPICAPKIANRRRDEMRRAMAAHLYGNDGKATNGMVYLLTYTYQHTADEGGMEMLDPSLDQLREAISSFKALRAYKAIMEEAGSIGQIRGLEVTYGEINGWHPHVHELCFANKGALQTMSVGGRAGFTRYSGSILGRLRKAWARHLIKRDMAGLQPGDIGAEKFRKLRALLTRCCTVQCGAYADEYIAKFGRESESTGWDMANELTKGHTKTPRRASHTTPWGLLADSLDGDKRAGWLFREYAEAFAGKRQLFWSPGLKEKLGIEEISDDDISKQPEVRCDEKVIQLTDEQWRLILSRNARLQVLRTAAIKGRMGVLALLRELGEAPARYSDEYQGNGVAFIPLRR